MLRAERMLRAVGETESTKRRVPFWLLLCLLVSFWRIKSVFSDPCASVCLTLLHMMSKASQEQEEFLWLGGGVSLRRGGHVARPRGVWNTATSRDTRLPVCSPAQHLPGLLPIPLHQIFMMRQAGGFFLGMRFGFLNGGQVGFVSQKSVFARNHLFCIKQRDFGVSVHSFVQHGLSSYFPQPSSLSSILETWVLRNWVPQEKGRCGARKESWVLDQSLALTSSENLGKIYNLSGPCPLSSVKWGSLLQGWSWVLRICMWST